MSRLYLLLPISAIDIQSTQTFTTKTHCFHFYKPSGHVMSCSTHMLQKKPDSFISLLRADTQSSSPHFHRELVGALGRHTNYKNKIIRELRKNPFNSSSPPIEVDQSFY